ncbi:hypothetical protein B9Z65_79 [Elsinoe australis]|uniref:Uncharacterized protein n=1 Tax=Elsinoe australis TaxID=40998 RepID=A0A2P7ZKC9_9PEZI|nr:hypothetical protein B9Z65_79 [Elsinoe australis]
MTPPHRRTMTRIQSAKTVTVDGQNIMVFVDYSAQDLKCSPDGTRNDNRHALGPSQETGALVGAINACIIALNNADHWRLQCDVQHQTFEEPSEAVLRDAQKKFQQLNWGNLSPAQFREYRDILQQGASALLNFDAGTFQDLMPILLAFVYQTPQFSFTTINSYKCGCGIRLDHERVKRHDVVDAHKGKEAHLRCSGCGEMAFLQARVLDRLPFCMVTGPKMTATAGLKKVMKPVTIKARRHDGKDLVAVYHLRSVIVRKDKVKFQTFIKESPMDEEISLWTKYDGQGQPNFQHNLDETVMFGKEYEFVSAIYTQVPSTMDLVAQ